MHLKIHLYNERGKPKTTGGDIVNVLIQNTKLKAYSPGRVRDNGDGTYTGVVDALWHGSAEIITYIHYSREAVTATRRLRKEFSISK